MELVWITAVTHKRQDINRLAVAELLKGYQRSNKFTSSWAGRKLLDFNSADFDGEAKKVVRKILHESNGKRMIRVCGVAGIKEEVDFLGTLLVDMEKEKIGMPSWHARVARARLGVKDNVAQCMAFLDGFDDEVYGRTTHVMPEMAYIRQPETIAYLHTVLDGDDVVPSAGDAIGWPVATYAAALLATCVDGFPVVKRWGSELYTTTDIDVCRKWMDEQKEVKILR